MKFVRKGKLGSHLGVFALAAFASTVILSACGGDDLSCGSGTKKKGSKCVAENGVGEQDGGSGGSTGDGSAGSGGSTSDTGGSTSSGGAGGGTSTGGTTATDAGDSGGPVDTLDFAGATAAAPASQPGSGTPDSVLVTWNAASYPTHPEAVIHYEVFSAASAGAEAFSTPVAVAPPGSRFSLVQGLTAKTFFIVRAVSDVGSAKDTNTTEVSAEPKADGTPPTFGGVKAAASTSSSSVTVSWDPATDDLTPKEAITYRVYWAASATASMQLGAVSYPGDSQVEVKGLTAADTDFFFSVVAVDAAGNESPLSDPVSGKTGPDVTPPVFGGCRAVESLTAAGGNVIWDPAVDDTTPADQIIYNVYAFDTKLTSASSFDNPIGTFTGVTQGLIAGLDSAVKYSIVCRAADASGNEDQNRSPVVLTTLSDGNPPTFASGAAATLQRGSTTIDIAFPTAHDDKTLDSAIEYLVYASTVQGDQMNHDPILSWIPGQATTYGTTIPKDALQKGLPPTDTSGKVSNKTWYVSVTARDQAKNESAALPEVSVTTLISFNDDVQEVFDIHCALTGCHVPPTPIFNPPQGQVLARGYSYKSIVDVVAGEGINIGEPTIFRVASKNPDLTQSYLWRKINGGLNGSGTIMGSQMPPSTSTGPQLTVPDDFDTIKLWILQDAQNN